MLDREIAPGSGAALSRSYGHARLDRRVSTVLFADIVGSTRMVAAADPEEARDRLSEKLGGMRHHVTRFGGTVCQVMGDGLLAIFGAPYSLEDHALRACLAAEAIAREGRQGGQKVRVGLSTGEILWEGKSSGSGESPPAVGLAVHVAAKLQAIAPVNGVKLSEATFQVVSSWLDAEETGTYAVDDDAAFRIFDLRHVRRRRRKVETSPLIGRDSELRRLVDAIDSLRAGEGSTHILTGPAGVGKSRLAVEAAENAERAQVRVLDWHINPIRPVGAPEPLQELVADLIDRELPSRREVLEAILADHGLRPQAAAALVDFVIPDQRRKMEITIEAMVGLAAEGSATLLQSVARHRPLLLLIDDLHLAGSEVAAAVRAMMERCTRVMVLATSREPMADAPAGVVTTPVDLFDAATARAMLDRLLGDAPDLDRVKRALAERSGGNPYFLGELVRGMVADRLLVGSEGHYQPGEEGKGRLPESLQSLLASRIDRLPELERATLLAAAVVGPTFDAALLSRVLGREFDHTAAVLSRLVAAGLLDNTRLLPREEFSFRHALVQETAYATLTKKDRRQLHQAVVGLLESAEFADLPGRLATLARHAFDGELWAKAVDTGRAAGMDAFSRCLAAEGIELLSRAVDAHDRLPDGVTTVEAGVELRMNLARTYMMLGEPERTIQTLHRMVDLVGSGGVRSLNPDILSLLTSANIALGRIAEAFQTGQRAMDASRDLDTKRRPHYEIVATQGFSLIEKGDILLACQILQEDLQIADSETQIKNRFMRLNAKSTINVLLGRCYSFFDSELESMSHFQSAWKYIKDGDHPFDQIYYWVYLAEVQLARGEYSHARSSAISALQIIEATGARMLQGYARALSGAATVMLGDCDDGMALIQLGLRDILNGPRLYEGPILRLLAESSFSVGNLSAAEMYGQRTLTLTVVSGADGVGAAVMELLGRCSLARKDEPAARRLLLSAMARASRLGHVRIANQCSALIKRAGLTENATDVGR